MRLELKIALAVLLLCVIAWSAMAETAPFKSRYSMLPGDGVCYEILQVDNRAGFYNFTETFATAKGPVTVRYETVGGHNPNDHDLIDVLATPEGVVATPLHIDLPDGETGHICLMEYIGG